MPLSTNQTGVANTDFSEVDQVFAAKFAKLGRKKFPGQKLSVEVGTFSDVPALYLHVDGKLAPAPYHTWIVRGPVERMYADAKTLNAALNT